MLCPIANSEGEESLTYKGLHDAALISDVTGLNLLDALNATDKPPAEKNHQTPTLRTSSLQETELSSTHSTLRALSSWPLLTCRKGVK